MNMREVKVVAYGSISEDDERLIINYLEEKDMAVHILSVDVRGNRLKFLEQEMIDSHGQIMDQEGVINEQNVVIAAYSERIEELEAADGSVADGDADDGD